MPDLELLKMDAALLQETLKMTLKQRGRDIDAENDPNLTDFAVVMLIIAERYHHVFSSVNAIKELYEDTEI